MYIGDMPETLTPSQRLAEKVLGRSLAEYVAEKRSQERPRWSWQDIADQLTDDTAGEININSETLRLWYINDESTASLMADFYRHLRQPGVTKADALRRAQLLLIDDNRFKHPYFWGPFLIIGNWL